MATPFAAPPLNEVQLMLLKLFSRPIDGQDLAAIRAILLDYYDQFLQKEVDEVIERKQIRRADFDTLLNEDQRTR